MQQICTAGWLMYRRVFIEHILNNIYDDDLAQPKYITLDQHVVRRRSLRRARKGLKLKSAATHSFIRGRFTIDAFVWLFFFFYKLTMYMFDYMWVFVHRSVFFF